jgi:putative endonuclease
MDPVVKIRKSKFFYVYILRSIKYEEFYTGYTNDLKKRVDEHNHGMNSSTKRYRPWQLIYYEACLEKDDAIRREYYLKTSQGRRLIKRRMKDYSYKCNH